MWYTIASTFITSQWTDQTGAVWVKQYTDVHGNRRRYNLVITTSTKMYHRLSITIQTGSS